MKIIKQLNIKEDLHYQIFTLLNDMYGWGISPSDIRILAELYNRDFEMASSGEVTSYESRMEILFSSKVKKEIMEKLNISYNTFNNSLSKLRRKDFISKNTINERRLYNLSKGSFSFTIEFLDTPQYQQYLEKNKKE
jgi:predicted transcriptional regulator